MRSSHRDTARPAPAMPAATDAVRTILGTDGEPIDDLSWLMAGGGRNVAENLTRATRALEDPRLHAFVTAAIVADMDFGRDRFIGPKVAPKTAIALDACMAAVASCDMEHGRRLACLLTTSARRSAILQTPNLGALTRAGMSITMAAADPDLRLRAGDRIATAATGMAFGPRGDLEGRPQAIPGIGRFVVDAPDDEIRAWSSGWTLLHDGPPGSVATEILDDPGLLMPFLARLSSLEDHP